jgi:hypothetical protein
MVQNKVYTNFLRITHYRPIDKNTSFYEQTFAIRYTLRLRLVPGLLGS